jgi:hypothetical protein
MLRFYIDWREGVILVYKKLEEKIETWKNMPRNNANELSIADEYFDSELMPLSKEVFVKKHTLVSHAFLIDDTKLVSQQFELCIFSA